VLLQQVPTEQSYIPEQGSPIWLVPRHVPVWQFMEVQSEGAVQLDPFGRPPLCTQTFDAHFPERHSPSALQVAPIGRWGSHTVTVAPDTSVRGAQRRTHGCDPLQAGRHPPPTPPSAP
jgi:hypothetical protein